MYYPGFFERKKVDEKKTTLTQLLQERDQINQDIQQAQKELTNAEEALDRLTNPTINIKPYK